MPISKTERTTALNRLTVAVTACLSLLFIRCSDDGSSPPAQPYQACTAKDQCESNMPTCAHGTTYVCGKTAHECAYYLKNVTGCSCIEGVIRECPLSGGGMGVQRCNEVGTDKTNWGACGTLADALDDG